MLKKGARSGAKRATLEVRQSNEPARCLYERFGFTVAGIRRGYYTRPVEDALVLWREDLGVLLTLNRGGPCVTFAAHVEGRRTMDAQPHDLKAELLKTDEEFHDLAAKHHELEDRLHELTAKHYLSEPEQVEEVTLKKRKLQLKDRMEDILRRHRQELAHG